jgi:diketogulonate reductase-like aldo/keto reductase
LIHAPWATWLPQNSDLAKKVRYETWLTLIDIYNEGKCRAIGVSNYMPRHIQELKDAGLTENFLEIYF